MAQSSIQKNFANHFSSACSDYTCDSNFHPSIVSNKNEFFGRRYSDSSVNITESDITIVEFYYTISSVSGKTSGADRVSYSMLKNSPYSHKSRIIKLYSNILCQGVYLQSIKKHSIKTNLMVKIKKTFSVQTKWH